MLKQSLTGFFMICHDLDHPNKLHCFALATSIHSLYLTTLDYGECGHNEQSNPDVGKEHSNDTPATISFTQLITSSL